VSRIIVLGAGMCGLAAGVLLSRDGHDVTVLERDSEPVPESVDDAWERWARDGVKQFRLAHILLPRGRMVLDEEMPDVVAALAAAGGLQMDFLALMPRSVTDRAQRDGDERFVTMTARRPVLEQALARAAEAESALELRRGVSVRELVMSAYDGIPHVSGVRTESGEELLADLVVDAMGRRSQLPRWLVAAGTGPVHEEVEDSGFIYYMRHFRAQNGGLPEFRAPVTTSVGTFSLITLPADNGTWSVTVFISAGDRPLKRLREPELWTALVAACPLHAQWLDGEPITGVLTMGGVLDRYRRFRVDGQPVTTGLAAVGDAWACSNPSLGRGMTLGLRHVQLLRQVVREHLDDPRRFVDEFDAATEAELEPWYRETVEEDRARMSQIEALRCGLEPLPPSGPSVKLLPALLAALARDVEAFRAFIASRSGVTRLGESFANEGFVERISELARDGERPPLPGPNRTQLLALLGSTLTAA
jgi:2-polyprenyl-6-methoxyphenol hydroxylase-like FAD-dependent oxidoreductase